MSNQPKAWLIAQGSVSTPKLDIALWGREPVEEAKKMAIGLSMGGYFMFTVIDAEEEKQLASIRVEPVEPTVIVR